MTSIIKRITECIESGNYDDAWNVICRCKGDNTKDSFADLDCLAEYMKVRDCKGLFYGYLISYGNPKKQKIFQKLRGMEKLCKLLFPSVRDRERTFFTDRYKCEAEQFAKDMLPRRIEFLTHIEDYDNLYHLMADNLSKKTFICLIASGIFMRYEFYELAKQGADTDYYPTDIFPNFNNEVIADCGGYIGDTADFFIGKYGLNNIQGYYLYEPDAKNALVAEKKYGADKKFHILNAAVSDNESIQTFDARGGASGTLSENGKITVNAVTLDRTIASKVSLIKMDIEGAEASALKGSVRHLKEDKPKLAICAYHKPDDLRVLIGEILESNPSYKIYLRHYSPKHKETVIYAV